MAMRPLAAQGAGLGFHRWPGPEGLEVMSTDVVLWRNRGAEGPPPRPESLSWRIGFDAALCSQTM